MSSSDGKDFRTDITADPSSFEAGLKKATKAVTDFSSQVDGQFKKIGDTVNTVNKYFLGLTAVIAGGGALKKFISDANEWNGEAGKMAKQLGITTEKASILNVALNHLGIGSDVFTTAAEKLSKQIQSNGQAFDVLGVKTRDASGAYRPVTELMQEVNDKLAAIKNPIEQNIAGQQVYGRGWSEIRGILRLTSDGMTEAERRARQLGLIVGPEGVAMSKQYSMQMRDLGLVGKSLEVQFGNALLPVFTRTGKFLGEEGPAMGKVFATVLESILFGASAIWLALKDMGDGIGALAAQGAALLTGDLEAFRAIGRERDEQSKKNEEAYERLKAGYGQAQAPASVPADPNVSGGPKYRFKEKGEAAESAASSRMGQWEAALADKKSALEREGLLDGQYRELSKSEELKYWQALKSMRGLSDSEKVALQRKTAETEMGLIRETFEMRVATLQTEAAAFKNNTEERMRIEREVQAMYAAGTKEYEQSQKRIVEIQRQAADQERAIRESRVQAEREARLQVIALEEQQVQVAQQMGALNNQQALAQQEQFEQRRNAVALEALLQRLETAKHDPDRNPVEIEKINREIEQLESQHQQRLGAIRQQAAVETSKPITDTFRSIQSSWASLINNLLSGTLSIGGFIRGLFMSVGQAVIGTLSQIAAKWAVDLLLEKVLGKATAISQITANAGVAGAAATASAAAIPFYGWAIAPEAGATAFAAAMSYLPSASAAQGFDIPSTINPIVQTHAREMILPAKHADVIRSLADSSGPAVQAPAQPPVQLRGVSAGDFFVAARRDLIAVLNGARRDFALTK